MVFPVCVLAWSSVFTYLTCCERLFSQMRILEERLSAAGKILICEMSRREDKTSSCNHNMDLVIGGITLMLIGTLGER